MDKQRHMNFRRVRMSLEDLIGKPYIAALCESRAVVTGERRSELLRLARRKVDFYPLAMQKRVRMLLPRVGSHIRSAALRSSATGAGSQAFNINTHVERAPLFGFGLFRVGEDGRLYLMTKCEHYHASLGHGFPGCELLSTARRLGIPNATHNNTRGHIIRLHEEELIRLAAGLPKGDHAGFARVLASRSKFVLNRVLNLQTGSLAMEAAIKMILARFYRCQDGEVPPPYAGRTPVMVVIGNAEGDLPANYHGTTLTAQMMRGMWPDICAAQSRHGIMRMCAIRPNRIDDLEAAFSTWEKPPYKVAGFFHELVMMNYGARVLSRRFIRRAHTLCRQHDVPTVVDEIQSCIWSPRIYMYHEYGIRPTMLAVGKGMSGGEYASSRILFSSAMDKLPQFGALVTNGQEELAALSYLITLHWAEANADLIERVGDYYAEQLDGLVTAHRDLVADTEGCRHMKAITFTKLAAARRFTAFLNERGLDISVQTYKEACPPTALVKLPLTADRAVVDLVINCMAEAFCRCEQEA